MLGHGNFEVAREVTVLGDVGTVFKLPSSPFKTLVPVLGTCSEWRALSDRNAGRLQFRNGGRHRPESATSSSPKPARPDHTLPIVIGALSVAEPPQDRATTPRVLPEWSFKFLNQKVFFRR